MLIACDVDGVVADLDAEWYARYNRDYADNLTPARVLSWDLHRYVKPACGARIYDYLMDADLYEHVPPVAGALEGVRHLRLLGHDVLFVTHCTQGMVDQKARWLVQHDFVPPLGRSNDLPEDLVVTRRKSCIAADLLIDDGAHNIEEWVRDARRRAIILNQPHNASMDLTSAEWLWCQRALNWEGIIHAVEGM